MPFPVSPFITAGDALSSALAGAAGKAFPMPKQVRGFAAMSPEKRRAISRKGGASVDPAKRSFSQNRDLAVSAGRKGGGANRGGGRTAKVSA